MPIDNLPPEGIMPCNDPRSSTYEGWRAFLPIAEQFCSWGGWDNIPGVEGCKECERIARACEKVARTYKFLVKNNIALGTFCGNKRWPCPSDEELVAALAQPEKEEPRNG